MPEYEKISAHLHQIDSNIQDLSDKYAQLNKQTPKDVNFQILGENHDVKQAFGVEQGLMVCTFTGVCFWYKKLNTFVYAVQSSSNVLLLMFSNSSLLRQ